MPFIDSDLYTTSGTVKLVNLKDSLGAFPAVTKFNTNSVYTADSDNVPLNQLERRTDYLVSKQGFDGSTIAGMSIVVSATNAAGGAPYQYDSSSNVFKTVEAAIDALPQTIKFPIIMEVASFGNLGDLLLKDLHFTASGSLEIINRNFARVYSGSANFVANDTDGDGDDLTISSLDLSNTFLETSSAYIDECSPAGYGNGLINQNGVSDPRFAAGQANAYFVLAVPNKYGKDGNRSLHVGVKQGLVQGGAANKFKFDAYEFNNSNDQTTYVHANTQDILPTNDFSDETLFRRGPAAYGGTSALNGIPVGGIVTGNHLESIKIQNCNGPIYVRGFVVDGGTRAAYGANQNNIGIEIINSDVVLENCASMRNKKAGILAVNSRIIANRGLFAYRNYNLSSATGRDSDDNAAGIQLIQS